MIKKFVRKGKSSKINIPIEVFGFRQLFQFISRSFVQFLNIWISLTLFKHMRFCVHCDSIYSNLSPFTPLNTNFEKPYSTLRSLNNSYDQTTTTTNAHINYSYGNSIGKPHDVIVSQNKSEKVGNKRESDFRFYENEYNQRKAELNSRYESSNDILHFVLDGLGLKTIPDMKKINVSQAEYVNKYKEYLQRINSRKKREKFRKINQHSSNALFSEMHIISFFSYDTTPKPFHKWSKTRRKREIRKNLKTGSNKNNHFKRNQKSTTLLHFSLEKLKIDNKSIRIEDIEEANLRLLLIYNSVLTRKHKNEKIEELCNTTETKNSNVIKYTLKLRIFQRLQRGKRLWIDRKKVEISVEKNMLDNTHSQWVELNVMRAVQIWLKGSQKNLDLELQCDNCVKAGARILSDFALNSSYPAYKGELLVPVINIVMRSGQGAQIKSEQQSDERIYNFEEAGNSSSTISPSSCQNTKSKHPRCCRHSMQVVFSQVKGFEFIIQPKTFDAGYCFGRCPLRYNPANHHAMLQGLIWKQSNGLGAPRPCCAPSKLVELEVLHLDEKNSNKLKISTWNDMRVIECACS